MQQFLHLFISHFIDFQAKSEVIVIVEVAIVIVQEESIIIFIINLSDLKWLLPWICAVLHAFRGISILCKGMRDPRLFSYFKELNLWDFATSLYIT